MLKLHALYRQNKDSTWDAAIEWHPYILVERSPCLDSAKELIRIYAAEELGKTRWDITKESLI